MHQILLRAEADAESVSAGNRVYPVTDGYLLVEVDEGADAAPVARDICRLAADLGFGQKSYLFRPATADEVRAYTDRAAAAKPAPEKKPAPAKE